MCLGLRLDYVCYVLFHVLHDLKRAETEQRIINVEENDSLILNCPPGNITLQKWIFKPMKTEKAIRPAKRFLLNGLVAIQFNTTTISDEGMYECHEDYAVLVVARLTVKGRDYVILYFFCLYLNIVRHYLE